MNLSVINKRALVRVSFCIVCCLCVLEVARAAFPTVVREPRRGVMLVADKAMLDPNFAHTVVLITDHNLNGSIGLIVNRVSDIPVVASLPELRGREDPTNLLRFGGPVEMNSVRLLVRSARAPEAAEKILPDVYFVNSLDALDALLTEPGARAGITIHYFAGFAAWSPGQLEAEIARGDWHLVKGDARTVFAPRPAATWPELIEKLEGLWVLVENGCRPAARSRVTCE